MFIRGAKLSVYPSSAEGFGIPPLETVAAKIPTICANETAMSDFIFLGENLVSLKNETLFQEKICEAINNPEQERSLIKKANFVKTNYNWPIDAARYLDAIKETIDF